MGAEFECANPVGAQVPASTNYVIVDSNQGLFYTYMYVRAVFSFHRRDMVRMGSRPRDPPVTGRDPLGPPGTPPSQGPGGVPEGSRPGGRENPESLAGWVSPGPPGTPGTPRDPPGPRDPLRLLTCMYPIAAKLHMACST